MHRVADLENDLTTSDVERPVLEAMPLSFDRWLFWGRTHIKVYPGMVEFDWTPLTGPAFKWTHSVHTDHEISVFRARVPILLMPTGIRLVDEEGRVLYLSPYKGRKRLLTILREAGFNLRYRSTWLIAAAPPWAPRS